MSTQETVNTWNSTTEKLRRLLNEDTYDRWISGIVPLEFDNAQFRLGVSSTVFSEWLTANYRELIANTVADVTGKAVRIVFESGHDVILPAVTSEQYAPRAGDVSSHNDSKPSEAAAENLAYNRRFTFDNFVIGENNKFAHAASFAVSKAPGKAYNPLFIHGPTGLGKTHLLQAIGQELLQRRKRVRVEYLSSEEFANTYIDALSHRALPKFRQRFRNVDLLLIDDVQFFTGKEQFQEEFFHTFNALYNGHKQIVLTSDRPPHEIRGVEKRLVSRFEWGLTTEVMMPDIETRLAILRRKQEDHHVQVNDEVLNFVASRVKSNIRRLEGALIRLVSYMSMTGLNINLDIAQQLLRPILEEESINNLTLEEIQRAVAEYYDIRLADMTSKRRPANIAFPRQVAMFLCRRLTDYSSPAIADSFNRNHATILHAVSSVEKKMTVDTDLRNTVGKLERTLKR